MKTRSKPKPKASTSKSQQDPISSQSTTLKTLPPSASNPPHVAILPKNLSASARILTLPNPATNTPSRYLIDAEVGRCFEFTRVAGGKRECRSWLLAPDRSTGRGKETGEEAEAYVMEKPDLLVATPIDPLFLILPSLAQDIAEGTEKGKGMQMYLSPSDFLDRLETTSTHFRALAADAATARLLEAMFEPRLREVCDSMEIGEDERLYRLSLERLLTVLCAKAKRVVEGGVFPRSMEGRFVGQALEVPVLAVRREESGVSVVDKQDTSAGADEDTPSSVATSQQDSQMSTTTTTSSSTAATSVLSEEENSTQSPSKETSGQIPHLLRLRTVLDYMLKSYIPSSLHTPIQALLAQQRTSNTIDFTPLTTHLTHVDTLKREAQTLRSLSDNISRKRSAVDDDDAEAAAVERAEAKKRKKEEEEARKKNVSRGVKALEKVDRSGMKTLSSFFAKKG